MAPELRKRAQAPAKKTEQAAAPSKKATTKVAAAEKRKAPEQASPVAVKKQKSTTGKASTKKETAVNGADSKKKEAKKPSAKKAAPEVDDDSSEAEAEDDEQTKALARVLDEGSDDDDVEEDEGFQPGQDVGKIPEIKDAVKKSAKAAGSEEPGVVYIARIPHGFYEHEMRAYLSQFGAISKLRLSRNKKTGASRHYAFVEFAEASTAEVVAKTMDNYLLFGHLLKCKVVPAGQVHDKLFKGANRRFKKVPWNKMAGRQLEQPQSETAWGKKIEKEEKRRQSRAEKLKALGYDFEGPQLKAAEAITAGEEPAALENGVAEAPEAIEAPPAEEEKEEAKEEAPKVTKAKATAQKSKKGAKAKKAKA